MFRVGLTGGIGSGKSTVAGIFRDLDVAVIDLDQIAREIVRPNSQALQKIAEHFGDKVLTAEGQLDRPALRYHVFSNPSERQWLEALLHPLIHAEQRQIEKSLRGSYLIIEIPLLVENIESQSVDRILVVDLPETLQVQRTMDRSHLSESEVRKIMGNQVTREMRLRAADDIIENHGSATELIAQVKKLHQKYLAWAADAGSNQQI